MANTPTLRGNLIGRYFTLDGSLVPSENEVFDLGTSTMRFNELYLAGSTIHLGTTSLKADPSGGLVVETPTSTQALTPGGGFGVESITTSNVYVERFFGNSYQGPQYASAPTYSWSNDTDTGVYNPDVNVLGFVTAANERMRIDSAGNIGIGTLFPQTKLHVVGSVQATSFVGDGSQLTGITGGGGGDSVWTNDILNGGVYVMSSNVGIGTTAPLCALHVNDTIPAASIETPVKYPPANMSANTQAITSALYGNGTYIASASSTNNAATPPWKGFNGLKSYEQWWESSSSYTSGTGVYAGATTTLVDSVSRAGEWLQIQMAEPIFLATYAISPRQDSTYMIERKNPRKWWLAGSTDGTTWTLIDSQSGILWSTSADKSYTISGQYANSSYTYFRIIINETGNSGLNDNHSALIGELTLNGTLTSPDPASSPSVIISADGVPKVTVNGSGNVGIGTTTPQQELHVEGTVKATAFIGDGSQLTGISGGGNSQWITNASGVITNIYITGSSNVGIGTTNPIHKLQVEGTVSGQGLSGQLSNKLSPGSYLTGSQYNNTISATWEVDATSSNTASKVVARDASGNFSAGMITATSLITNSIQPSSGTIIDMGGSTLSNVTVSGATGGGGGTVTSSTSNIYFYAARGGSDFTINSTTIGGWSTTLTTQTPTNIFNTTTGVFTAPVTGTYMFNFGLRNGNTGELLVRVNNVGKQNFFQMYYGTVTHRLNAGNTLDLFVSGSCTFYPAFNDNRVWFQGALLYLG